MRLDTNLEALYSAVVLLVLPGVIQMVYFGHHRGSSKLYRPQWSKTASRKPINEEGQKYVNTGVLHLFT